MLILLLFVVYFCLEDRNKGIYHKMSKYSSDSDEVSYRSKRHGRGRSHVSSDSSASSHFSRKLKRNKKRSHSRSRDNYKYKKKYSPENRTSYNKRSSRDSSRSRDKYIRDKGCSRSISSSRSRQKRRSRSGSYRERRRKYRSRSLSRSHERSRSSSRSKYRSRRQSRSTSIDSYKGRSKKSRSRSTSKSKRKINRRSSSKEKVQLKSMSNRSMSNSSSNSEKCYSKKMLNTIGDTIYIDDSSQSQPKFDVDKIFGEHINYNTLEEINSCSFAPKAFVSSKQHNSENNPIVVDLTIPTVNLSYNDKPNSIFHPNLLVENKEEKLNRWVKKLFQIRQRYYGGELLDINK
uniref:Uncharacterized protein n=3 Tax=Clastoptera arizonana TaxID=38151 RepID=A0A1B6D5R4_9HEMI